MVRPTLGLRDQTLVSAEGRRSPAVERRIGLALIIGTFVFAFVVQSQFFAFTNSAKGDIAYHRGVAGTMLGGNLEGEGPLPGLLSYYGGLYPLTIGYMSRALGASFDGTLSVLSWFATLALPATLVLLGRRVWPRRPLEVGMLVFIGTVGSSLGTNKDVRWVGSFLPSGANMWPVYPRDIGLTVLVLALAVAMGGSRPLRAVLVGILAGIGVCVQPQLGLLTIGAVWAWILTGSGWPPKREAVWRALLVTVAAAAVSAWWWIPRLVAVMDYQPLALQSWPSKPLHLGPVVILEAFGATGFLMIAGFVLSVRAGVRSKAESFFLWWVTAAIPAVIIGSILGDQGIITPRRAWFLASVPVVVLAARAGTALVRRTPLAVGLPLIVLAIAVPSTAEVLETRRELATAWADRAPRAEPFAAKTWDPVLALLRDQVWSHGPMRVIAPDNDAAFVWSETGAQPFSLWLSGADKLGFDAKKATGIAYMDRVRRSQRAFASGRAGLCALARDHGVDALVLRAADGLIAFRDLRPSTRWRVGPGERSHETVLRRVGPGLLYRDKNSFEDLELPRHGSIPLGFSGAGIQIVDVQLGIAYPDQRIPTTTLVFPDGSLVTGQSHRDGITVTTRFKTPAGVPPGTSVMTLERTTIIRLSGYEHLTGLSMPVPSGARATPMVVATDQLCRR